MKRIFIPFILSFLLFFQSFAQDGSSCDLAKTAIKGVNAVDHMAGTID